MAFGTHASNGDRHARLPRVPLTGGALVELAPGAEENGLASMLAELIRQNLESKPHKKADFEALDGSAAIVAVDADVSLTIRFCSGRAIVFDGIVGVPDVTVRGSSDTIMALSTVPLATPFALPVPHPRRAEEIECTRTLMKAMREGSFKVHGMVFHLPFVLRLTRVMSVNG